MSPNEPESGDGKLMVRRETRLKWVHLFAALMLLAQSALGLFIFWRLPKIPGDFPGRSPLVKMSDADARQKLERADELAAAGKLAESARLSLEVAQGAGSTRMVAAATVRVSAQLQHSATPDSASELAAVVRVAVALQRTGRWPEPAERLYKQGSELVNQRSSTDPAGALEILEAIAPMAPKGDDLNKTRCALLEKLVAAHPDDPELLSRLAAVFEAQGQQERAVALLEPIRARVGTTEGARILGLADARGGRVERALNLLRPYVRTHLESLRAADKTFQSAAQGATRRVVDQLVANALSSGSHPADAEKNEGILNGIDGLIKGDPEFEQARQRKHNESSVVPAALELGMILLTHAQSQIDRKSRESLLDEAETLFLDVSRVAGAADADRHRLCLAEVYYWRDKLRDGRTIIDQVLEARKRDPWLLMEVSSLLRRVGSMGEARALSEEAYHSGQVPLVRFTAAVQRSLMGLDLDDTVLWLGRGDPNDPGVKAFLRSEKGNQAIERGDDNQAIAEFREAVLLYDTMPEEPATLNNTARVLFRLSELTGDRAAFDRGFAGMEKAQKLQPSDSINLMNLALFVVERALSDIIGPAIDLQLLKEKASLEQLAFLYNDSAGHMAYVQRLRTHAGIDRQIALLEKALLLAPRRGDLYKMLNELYWSRGETEKQRGLLERLEHTDLDQSDEIAWAKSIYAGGQEEQRRNAASASILRAESALKRARARSRDITFAVAASGLANARMNGYFAGLEADADAIVGLAEEAYATAPSYQTRSVLTYALLFRAGRRLAQTQPRYARMAEKTRLSTRDYDLIGVALHGGNPLREAARQNPDVRQAVTLICEAYRENPDYEAVPWCWSLLSAFDPDEAGRMVQTYLKNESAQFSRAIQKRVEPASASAAMSLYWAAEMVGRNADGPAILKAYATRGVPLPIELP